jgi:uncharacterized protein
MTAKTTCSKLRACANALAWGLTLAAAPALAAQPSFDCAKAAGDVEELICQDDELAALDRTMAETYDAALKKAPPEEIKTLKAFQRGWIKGRDDCWKAEDLRACVQANYETRITELQIAYGDQVVPEPVLYTCEDGATITAVFYQDTQRPAAVLTRIPEQVVAFLSPAGSGSKYEGGNVTFWTRGEDAMVT